MSASGTTIARKPGTEDRRGCLPSRRAFLIGAGASVGVLVGFALWPRRWPNAMAGDPDDVVMNAWLRIGPDGRVTVAVPQAEMGQGIWSGFAQIVADELGAAWRMMAVEPATFHPAYAHLWLAEVESAQLPPVIRDVAAYAGETAISRMNLHLTAGSTSIRGYHDRLREAAATARALLIAAAARSWGVSAEELDTANGMVFYKANRMPFGDAVQLVDPEQAPAHAVLRPLHTRRLAGKPLPRIDIPAKINGGARFGADVRVPDLVYAAIRHGPVGPARLLRATAPAGVTLVKGPNWVATIGRTNWEARRALEKVEASFAVDGRSAGPWMAGALREAADGSGGATVGAQGESLPEWTETSISADYSVPFVAHACTEPLVATARITGDQVELWGPTQSLTFATRAVAAALNIDANRITIYPTLGGGGFGRRIEPDAMVEAALIARAVDRPVQLLWSRGEDLTSGVFRPAAAARMRGEVAKDGAIMALEARIAVPSAAHGFAARHLPLLARSMDSPNARAIVGADSIPYAASAFRAVHVPVELPVASGYWRGGTHSFTCFFVECFIDELALRAGIDPLRFRQTLLADQPRHLAVLAAAAEAADYGADIDPGFARGIALHQGFGSVVAMVMEAGVVEGKVRIARVTSAIDCGTVINPDSVRAQVEGAAIMGLSAALAEEITFANGYASQRDFDTYAQMLLQNAPEFQTILMESEGPPGGAGDPGAPPAAPALANALAAATNKRARNLPLAGFYGG
ncbi:MAG: molybdopterin cofactor-binding domain-containing protein [Sphingomonadaceae bacterium]